MDIVYLPDLIGDRLQRLFNNALSPLLTNVTLDSLETLKSYEVTFLFFHLKFQHLIVFPYLKITFFYYITFVAVVPISNSRFVTKKPVDYIRSIPRQISRTCES